MPATALLLPTAADVWYRPGGAYTLHLVGPAGWLDDHTFTVDIAGTPMDVTPDGDDLVVDIPDAFTTAHPAAGGKLPWTISVVGGNVVLAGWWRPSDSAVTSPVIELDVTLGTLLMPVTLVVGPAPTGGTGAVSSVNTRTGDVVGLAEQSALDAEVTTRAAADTALDGRLDAIEAVGPLASAASVTTEAGTRSAADAALDGRLDIIEALGDLATQLELDAEAILARNASNLNSGTVADVRIAPTIARDSEVATAVANEATARDAAIATAIANLVAGSPGILDTLKEIADALGDDPNFAATMTTALAGKQPLAATLTTLAGLATTAIGRNILTAANAGAIQAILSLTPGTDVQAHSAVLDATTASFTTAKDTKLSGIATGATANDTDANLHAYSDAKVEDALVDGVTAKAPSQNAVFDALALKAHVLIPTAIQTASYAANPAEVVPLNTASATPIVVTLPAGSAVGTVVEVGWILGANATATIVCAGSDTFQGGGTTSTLQYLYQFRRYIRLSSTLWGVQNSPPISGLDARYQALNAHLTALTTLGAAKQVVRVNAAGTEFEFVDPLGSLVDESHADAGPVNTTTETAAASLTLPAGAVAAGDLVRLTLFGDYLNNSGGSVNYTYKVKVGATTVMTSTTSTIPTTANRAKYKATVDIMIVSTTAQRVSALVNSTGAAATGFDVITASRCMVGYGTSAEDTSSSKTIQFTVTLNTANALTDFVCHAATLEVIKKR